MKKYPFLLQSILILAAAFALFSTSSCCRDKTITTLKITDEVSAHLPYNNGMNVWFVKNGRDTIKTMVLRTKDSSEVTCEGDCCDRIFQSYTTVAFRLGSSNFAEISAASSTLSFQYNANRFADLEFNTTTKQPVCDSVKGVFCYDSLRVNNRMHYKVYRFSRFYPQGDAKRLFYSKDGGILRVEYNNGDVYETL